MSELDSSREGRTGALGGREGEGTQGRGGADPDPKVWGRREDWKGAASLQEEFQRRCSQGEVGGGAGDPAPGCLALKASYRAPTLPGSRPRRRPPPRGPGRVMTGAAAVRRGSQVSLDVLGCAGACPAGRVGKAQGKHFLGSLSSRRGCRWLTAPGTGPREGRGIVFMPPVTLASPWAAPSQGGASGSLSPPPLKREAHLCSRELVSSPGQQGAGRRSPGCQPCPSGSGRAKQAGDHGSDRPPPAQAAGGTSSALVPDSSSWSPGSSLTFRPTASPLHYPFPPLVSAVPGLGEPFAVSTRGFFMDKLPWLSYYYCPTPWTRPPTSCTCSFAEPRVAFLPSPPPALPWAARPLLSRPPACGLPFEGSGPSSQMGAKGSEWPRACI